MTWSDYDDDRGFHIFDTETKDLTYVKQFSMFYKVFYDDNLLSEDEIIKTDFSHLNDTHVRLL